MYKVCILYWNIFKQIISLHVHVGCYLIYQHSHLFSTILCLNDILNHVSSLFINIITTKYE